MIRDAEWEWVREKIQTYRYWANVEALVRFEETGERACKLMRPEYAKDLDHSLPEILGQMVCIYFDETKRPGADEAAGELYDRCVTPAVDEAKQALETLLLATEQIQRKMPARKILSLMGDLDAVEVDLRRAWTEAFSPTVRHFDEKVLGNLGEEGARERLAVSLWIYLTDFTNLSKDNKIKHVAYFLRHFGIAGTWDDSPEENVRQLIFGRTGRGGPRRSLQFSQQQRRQWLTQVANRFEADPPANDPQAGSS